MHRFSRRLIKISEFFLLDRLCELVEARLWLQFLLLLALSVVLFDFAVDFYSDKIVDFSSFYDQRLRGFLFSGFLTVGSFLLSLKTFVVVNLKDKLFDTDSYTKTHMSRQGLASQDQIDYAKFYQPLANLTGFLFLSILFSIVTAVAQFSIGLMQDVKYLLFCVWLALFTVLLLLNCLRLIRKNLLVWLGYK